MESIWRKGMGVGIGIGRSTWLRGKPGSPGIAKLLSRAMFWTSFWASLWGIVSNCPILIEQATQKRAVGAGTLIAHAR